MERIPTRINGFDDLIGGGIPKGHSVLLSGDVGSYSNLFGLEFLYRGVETKEQTIYSVFNKTDEDLINVSSIFDWKIKESIDSGALKVHKSELFNFESYLSSLEDAIFNSSATRVVLDSISYLSSFFDSEFKLRNNLNEIKKILDRHECTTLLLSETGSPAESFASDGAIKTHLIQKDYNYVHAISVKNMNSTNFSQQIHPISINKSGLVVHKIPLVI